MVATTIPALIVVGAFIHGEDDGQNTSTARGEFENVDVQ